MSITRKTAVVVGSSCIDRLNFFNQSLPEDAKVLPVHGLVTGGGGGFNAATAMAYFYAQDGIDANVILHTKVGQESYNIGGQTIENQNRRRLMREMDSAGIQVRDMADGKFHYVPLWLRVARFPCSFNGEHEELF